MNTMDEELNLDPRPSVRSELNIENPNTVSVLEPTLFKDVPHKLDIEKPKQNNIESSLQISPKQQDNIPEKSVSVENQSNSQISQSSYNSNRTKVSDSQFDIPDSRAVDGIGRNNRLSAGTKIPSPMAAARRMDGTLEIRSNSLPEWRQKYS